MEDRPVWTMLIDAAQELLVMHRRGQPLSSTALLYLAQMVSEEARFVRRNGLSGTMVTTGPAYKLASAVHEQVAAVEETSVVSNDQAVDDVAVALHAIGLARGACAADSDHGWESHRNDAELVICAHYGAYQVAWVDADHQGGNLLEMFLHTYVRLLAATTDRPDRSADLAARIADAVRDANFVDPDDDTVPVFGSLRATGGSPGIDHWTPVTELVDVVLRVVEQAP